MRFSPKYAVMVAVLTAMPTGAGAAVAWNESTQGDISGNRTAPTLVALVPGDNDLLGSVEGVDLDYVTFVVPAQTQWTGLVVKSYQGLDATAFLGLQKGSIFTVDAPAAQPEDLYGWAHIFPGAGDVLAAMGQGFDAQGFTPPLGPGPYTLWIQQLGSITTYDFNLKLAVVTTPGDADGDGRITVDDYAAIDLGFANHLTGFAHGDFDKDGDIDADDYRLIDEAFVAQLGAPALGAVAVPEPAATCTGLLCVAGLIAVRRSTRRP
jgi:hypothetical protein